MPEPWPPPFQVRLSQRAKRILVSIHPQRGLEIVTPKRLSAHQALGIIQQHRAWIDARLHARQAHLPDADAIWPEHQLPAHIHLPALDEHWQLVHLATTTRAQLHIDPAQRQLSLRGEGEQIWSLLQRWFIAHAKAQLLPALHQLAEIHNDPLQGSGIRWNHTRWGSCSRAGRINLSARLLWLEPAEMNYVLHHELNHLHHFNHSPAFWQALEARLPGALLLDRGIRHAERRASFPAWLRLV
jgi:predicted metal-dependent hydrolase